MQHWRRTLVRSCGVILLFLPLIMPLRATAALLDPVRDFLVQSIIRLLSRALPGSVEVGAVRGSLLSAPVFYDIVLRDTDGTVVGEIDALHLTYDLKALLKQRLQVQQLTLVRPRLTLIQEPDGRWNLARLFAAMPAAVPSPPLEPGPETPLALPLVIAVEQLQLRQGHCRLQLPALPGVQQVDDLSLDLQGHVDQHGGQLRVRHLYARTTPANVTIATLAGAVLFQQGQVQFDQVQLRTDHTRLTITGTLPGHAQTASLQVNLQPLALAEAGYLLQNEAWHGLVTGSLTAEGPPAAVVVSSQLHSADGSVHLNGHLNMASTVPRYRASLEVAHLDLGTLSTREALRSDLNIQLHVDGAELSPRLWHGQIKLAVQPSQLGGMAIRPSVAEFEVQSQRWAVQRLQVDTAAGSLSATGAVDLEGASDLRYTLAANLAPLGPLLGLATLEGEVQGQGQLQGARTALQAHGTIQGKGIHYQAHRLDTLTLTLAGQALATEPQVTAQLLAQQGRFGDVPLDRLDLGADYTARQVQFTAEVRHSPEYSATTRGTLALLEGGQQLLLENLDLRLRERTWSATAPVDMLLAPHKVQLKALTLVHAHESLVIAGTLDNHRLHDVQLQVTALDLAALRPLVPFPGWLGERASGQVQLTGTLAEPVMHGAWTLDTAATAPLPAQRWRTVWHYAQQEFLGEVWWQQNQREVLALRLQLPIDLSLTPLPLEQRLRDAALALQVEFQGPNLRPIQHWFAGLPACTGTLHGVLTLQGPPTALALATQLELHDIGMQHLVEHVRATLQLNAVVAPAASLPALAQALAGGMWTPRLTQVELRVPRLRLTMPSLPAPAVQIEHLLVQGDGQWTPSGAQATLRTVQLRADGFGVPPASIAFSGRLLPQHFELLRLQARFPHSEVQGRGRFTRANQQVQADLELPRLRLDEFLPTFPPHLPTEVQGSLHVQGRLDAPQLTARLQYAGAPLVAEISTQWREPVPRYHATLRIDGLPVSRLLPTASGRLQAQVRLHGTGFTPSQRRAELEIRVDGQEVTIAPGLSVRAQASLDGAAIRLPSLQVQSLPLTLEASGALSASRQAMLRYTLTARDLRPLGEVLGLPLQARGQFSGSVQGTFPDLRVQNTLHLQEWSVAAFSGKGLKATLNGTHFPGDPQATLTASLAEVQTPALPASALSLQGKYQASRATLSASLTEGPYARSMLAAQMTLQDGLQVTLERFRVRRGSVSWEIVKPVQFQRDRQGAVTMSQLVLRHGIQTLSVRGSQSAAGVLDVAIQLQRLQLQSVLDVLAPDLPLPAGQGEVDVTVRGTLRQPQITGSVALTALHWQGQEFGALHARFDSVADTLYTEIHWRDQARELLQVAGTIGLSEGYPLALQIRATDVDLTRLKPFSAAILMSAGSAALDLRLTGTLLQPQAYGTLTLRDGALHLAPTGERYTHIAGQLAFAGQRVEIERLQAGSRQGTMQLSGWLASSGWAVSHLDVVLQAEKFTALHTPDIEALVSGIITVRGTPQDLSATGQVKIPRARIKMSGKLWGRPADVEPWELTVAGVYGSGRGDPSAAAGRSATRDPSLPFPFLRADLHIDMPRNVWVQGNGTAVELNGSMRVRKALQEPFILDGSIETIRGFASFYGKKFVLQEGKVVFPGTPEINPFLDVTMTQTIANYAVFIHVGGKVQTPLLTFTSTPDLPQAEIVSLLVLGKTTELLTNSEQSALSSQAQQIVGEVAAGELEKILGRPLGLDTVEIEAESSLGEGRISVGRYITQDIFLSYERQFGSEVGNTVGVEYSINRQLKIKGSGSDIGESAFDVLWRLDY